MNCPKCEQALSAKEVRGIEVDQCPSCRGIWFDDSELETILEHSRSDLRPLRSGREEDTLNRQSGKCPRDGQSMMRVCSAKKSEVVLDVCPECSGIWLDVGELDKLTE